MIYQDNDVLLVGAGGHSKVIIEILTKYNSDLNIAGILDKNEDMKGQLKLGIPILGSDNMLEDLYSQGLKKLFISLGTTGNYIPRLNIYNRAKQIGYDFVNVIHGTSVISDSAIMGNGNAVLAGAIINPEAQIGDNCIINTGSIVEHECIIGSNVHIATGAKLAGCVTIGDNCMIGIGTSIIQGIKIGENSIIGAGSVVIRDIPANSVAVGVPAQIIRKR